MAGRLGCLVGWAGLLVVLAFVAFIGGTYPWMGSQVVRIATWGSIGAVVAGWLLMAVRAPAWRPTREAVMPVLGVLGAALLSAVASPVSRVALGAVAGGALLALLFLALTRLAANPWFRPRLAGVLVAFWVIVVVGYLAQVGEAWWRWYAVLGAGGVPPLRPDGAALTFGAPPIVAAVVVLVGPFALVRIGGASRWVATALGLAGLLAILVSASRAAYLGVLVALLVAAWFAAGWRAGGWRGLVAGRLRGVTRTRAVAGLAVAAAVIAALGSPLAGRLADVNTVLERFDIWASAVALFSSSPLLGTGPGTWPILKYAVNPVGTANLVVPHAHSVLVQSVAELGLVGGGTLLVLVAVLGRRLVAAASASMAGDRELRAGGAGVLTGIAGLAGMSAVDDFANLLAVVVPFAALVAWVLGGLEGWEARGGRGQRGWGVTAPGMLAGYVLDRLPGGALAALALAAVGALGLAGLRVADAGLAAEAGYRAADRGDWPAALAGYRRAAATDPGMPLYQLELGAALAATGDRDAARQAYRTALGSDGYAMNVLSLAWLDLAAGDVPAALTGAGTALERGKGDPTVAFNAGAIAEFAGQPDVAAGAYADAVALLPELIASEYWKDAAVPRATVAALARVRLAEQDTPAAAIASLLLRAYLGEAGAAEAALRERPVSGDRDRALAVTLDLQGRTGEAIQLLRAALRSAPLDGNSAAALASLERRAGDTAAADRHQAWARMVGVGTAAQSSAAGSVVQPAAAAGTSGQPANYPWMPYLRFAGRVLTPPDYLVIGRP